MTSLSVLFVHHIFLSVDALDFSYLANRYVSTTVIFNSSQLTHFPRYLDNDRPSLCVNSRQKNVSIHDRNDQFERVLFNLSLSRRSRFFLFGWLRTKDKAQKTRNRRTSLDSNRLIVTIFSIIAYRNCNKVTISPELYSPNHYSKRQPKIQSELYILSSLAVVRQVIY